MNAEEGAYERGYQQALEDAMETAMRLARAGVLPTAGAVVDDLRATARPGGRRGEAMAKRVDDHGTAGMWMPMAEFEALAALRERAERAERVAALSQATHVAAFDAREAGAHRVAQLEGALLAYAQAHGNVRSLSRDLCEVEMFKAFLGAMAVLGLPAEWRAVPRADATP